MKEKIGFLNLSIKKIRNSMHCSLQKKEQRIFEWFLSPVIFIEDISDLLF